MDPWDAKNNETELQCKMESELSEVFEVLLERVGGTNHIGISHESVGGVQQRRKGRLDSSELDPRKN